MPFKSEAQRRFMFVYHPKIAKRWAHEYPNQGHLPMHSKDHHKMIEKSQKKSHLKRKK